MVMIEICFGLNFDNAQLCIVSFCSGYYLGKRRPPKVYVEIIDCIFRFKKMDAITNVMQNLEISKYPLLGKDLTTEKDFLQKVELTFKEQSFEQKIEFSYYVGKCCMCLSFQAEYFPSHEDVLKLVVLTEEYFA